MTTKARPFARARTRALNTKEAKAAVYRRGWRCDENSGHWGRPGAEGTGLLSLADACSLEGILYVP